MLYTDEIEKAMTVDIPEGTSGAWSVVKIEATNKDTFIHNMNYPSRSIPEGTYTVLQVGDKFKQTVMSDTPSEKRDHYVVINKAVELKPEYVRIHGLGLGMITQALFELIPSIKQIDVVEISPDVLSLVGPHYKNRYGDRLNLIEGDALNLKLERGKRWDMVWHDIWTNICADNWDTMKILHRKFGKRCTWQDSWARNIVKAEVRRESRGGWW